jgi:hypothetical protein
MQVRALTQPALRVFAHLGLGSVDDLGRSLVSSPDTYVTEGIAKIESPQLQSLITSYCFASKLAHLARMLPPRVVVADLERLEKMQVEVYNALTGGTMGGLLRARAIMPRRFGGVVPGVSPIAPAAFVASAMLFEGFAINLAQRACEGLNDDDDDVGPSLPLGLKLLVQRIVGREDLMDQASELTELEKLLAAATKCINQVAADHVGLTSRARPVDSAQRVAVPGGVVTGPAAVALAAVGGSPGMFFDGHDGRPAPFESLSQRQAPQRELANYIWVARFNSLWAQGDVHDRASLDEGATAGSGLFLQGIPCAPHFRFSSQVMTTQLRSYLGMSPAPSEPWTHKCAKGELCSLSGKAGGAHLFHCPQQGRALATHGAVLEQLRDMLLAASYGHGWHIERNVENPDEVYELRRWRADLLGYGPTNEFILIDATITCLTNSSNLSGRGQDYLNRTNAVLKDAEKRKCRVERIMATVAAHNAVFVPFALSSNGAFGPAANTFLKKVFDHVKAAGSSSMRSCHRSTSSTWTTTWFSTFWRQRLSTSATATSASFVGRILHEDSVAAQGGPRSTRPSYFPKFYNYNPVRGRQSVVYPRSPWVAPSVSSSPLGGREW